MATGIAGTIVELNALDAVGWIELDSGGRVRFGGSAVKGFDTLPGIGTRVEVRGTAPGYKGVLKALEVVPLGGPVVPPARAVREAGAEDASAGEARIPWAEFAKMHRRWSDVDTACVPCARTAPRPALRTHPLFEPWRAEIVESAPTAVSLVVPRYSRPENIDPGPADSFAHGRVAYLDQPRWPACGVCARPLEMCVQLSPTVMADFVPGGAGLAALFCFHCGVAKGSDPRVGAVRLVQPRCRVTGPEAWQSASSGWRRESQRVTARAPRAAIPGSSWLRYRGEWVGGETASAALFGRDDLRFAGPFPAGVETEWFDELDVEFDEWIDSAPGPGEPWGGAVLGGAAQWDQADATPSCAHGEMRHLLDYNGGQFLDGALHVFACREWQCELGFVAEF